MGHDFETGVEGVRGDHGMSPRAPPQEERSDGKLEQRDPFRHDGARPRRRQELVGEPPFDRSGVTQDLGLSNFESKVQERHRIPRRRGAPPSSRRHLRIKLATYKYNADIANPDPSHLGSIIEDIPRSPAVDSEHNRVDLYGYVSMVVATMQVQEKQIAELRKELEATRRSVASCRPPRK
jgi:hypothetical protein